MFALTLSLGAPDVGALRAHFDRCIKPVLRIFFAECVTRFSRKLMDEKDKLSMLFYLYFFSRGVS